ncbi:hypothetical protein HPB49_005302 [Dermacentor silvarum]|uniref:Uncharacterized protein n=1 Tax=Dermacentor silvarum TaxID=543639 RepID=A0ACB8DN51_DERSI|nr:hypothetical protein HPB49_005302 [Dermacentor silvarum]
MLVFAVLSGPQSLHFESYEYPVGAKMVGWCLAAFGLFQIPLFAYSALYSAKFVILGGRSTTSQAMAGAADHSAAIETSRLAPLREDAIRRMSVALGRTPNELRRMEVVLNRRTSAHIDEAKPAALASEEQKESSKVAESAPEKQRKKRTPPSTPPKLEIELLPPEPEENSQIGYGFGFVPIKTEGTASARAGSAAQSTVPPWGAMVPPEFAGLEAPPAPGEHLAILLTTPEPAEDARGMQQQRGGLRTPGQAAKGGHITINVPRKPENLKATIQGPPVIGYSDLLRRPSVKLTLLEPINGGENDSAEQVRKAIHDFRRKSMAVMRRLSVMPASQQFAGPPLHPGDALPRLQSAGRFPPNQTAPPVCTGGFPPYAAVPSGSISYGPGGGPGPVRRPSSGTNLPSGSLGGGQDVAVDVARLGANAQAPTASRPSEGDETEDDDGDDDSDNENTSSTDTSSTVSSGAAVT